MRKLLPFLALFVFSEVNAQSLSIGPNGISISSGTTSSDVTVQLDQNGLRVGTAAPPPPLGRPKPMTIPPNARLNCAGKAISVRGSGQNLTLVGRCPQVTVSGSGNTVRVEQVGRISVTGSRNTVIWTKGLTSAKPSTFVSGSGNRITASRPAPVVPSRPPTAPNPKPPQTAQRL